MSLQRTTLLAGLVVAVVLGGCVGGAAPGDRGAPPTDARPSERSTADAEFDGTPTMGEIPTMSDRTTDVLDEIRSKQADVESYSATITETRVVQLSNGSELTHVRKWRVWVKYTDDGVLARVESWSPSAPEERRIYVRNRTAAVGYSPESDRWRVDRNGGAADESAAGVDHPNLRSETGAYRLFTAPLSTVKKENAISYEGTETVNGRETYVVHLDGNPKGGNLAYYDAQTFWVDVETGLVVKQTAQKPRTDAMRNVSVAEVRGTADRGPSAGTPDPDAVYLGDKTITTTYTNVSVNSVDDDVFAVDIPENATVETEGSDV